MNTYLLYTLSKESDFLEQHLMLPDNKLSMEKSAPCDFSCLYDPVFFFKSHPKLD